MGVVVVVDVLFLFIFYFIFFFWGGGLLDCVPSLFCITCSSVYLNFICIASLPWR